MDLFSLAAKLSLDSGDYNKGVDNAESKLSKLADGAKKVGKVVGGAFLAAGTAVAGVAKQAMDAYAEFEQLEGGVKKLFGEEAAKTVAENAEKAFETAGMSANQYMETVTSFSAALIKSTGRGEQTDLEQLQATLDEEYLATKRSLEDQYDERKRYWDERLKGVKNKGYKAELERQRDEELKALKRQNEDTLAEAKKANKERLAAAEAANNASESSEESLARAAELADVAIRDMSDNANTFGTDMESIQNAYAGFAKNNYTMLDNLKLGYAGSKEGMEQLLADAEKLTGKKYDLSSYADIVEAIHEIQTSMNISGMSAEEAEAAAKEFGWTEEEMFAHMGTTAREAATTIEGSSKAMKSAWENLLVSFGKSDGSTKKATQNLVRTARNYFRNIMPVITQALSGIGDFFAEIAPMVAEELPKLIIDVVPKMFSAGKKLLKGLVDGAKSAVNKTKVAAWLGITDKNGNPLEDTSWEQIASTAFQKIRDRFKSIAGKAKVKIANWLGLTDDQGNPVDDPSDTSWFKIAQSVHQKIKDKFKAAANLSKVVLANWLGLTDEKGNPVDDASDTSWANIAKNIYTKIKVKFKAATNASKIALANWLGLTDDAGNAVDDPADTSWDKIAEKLKEKLQNGFTKIGVKLSELLGISPTTVGGEVDWVAIGKEIINKLTSHLSHKGDFLAKLILGDEFEKTPNGQKWQKVGERISEWIGEAFADGGFLNALLQTGTDGLTAIAEFAGKLVIGIADWISKNSATVVKIITTVAEALANAAGPIVNALIKVITDPKLWQAIIKAIGDVGEALVDGIFGKGTTKGIKKFLGLDDKSGLLTELQANAYSFKYSMDKDDPKKMEKFYSDLEKDLGNAKFSAQEIELIMNAIKNATDPTWVETFLKNLTDSEQKEEIIKQLAEQIDGDYNIVFNVSAYDPQGILDRFNTKFTGSGSIKTPKTGGDKPWESNAKGNWNVPYDDYLANLHRGEMVLTASQARQYREGEGQDVNFNALFKSIVGAVREGIENAQINAYFDPRKVTKETNRVNSSELLAGRYRP